MVFVFSRIAPKDNTMQSSQEGTAQTNSSPMTNEPPPPVSTPSPRRSSTSAIINPFESSPTSPQTPTQEPLSLAFLRKKKRGSSDPLIDIPSPSSTVVSPLMAENKLVRKKSGELVKSSLKLNQMNSKSMPNTPLFKNVHFGHDVDVRYFDEAEKPCAVSAQNSPTLKGMTRKKLYNQWGNGAVFEFNRYGGNNDYDDDDDEFDDDDLGPQDDWELEMKNFEKIRYNEKLSSKSKIFLETIFLNDDKDSIVGAIAVKNLSYQKSVHLRYTFDNWKTVIEIACTFESDKKAVPRILKRNNYDRFKFQLDLKNFSFLIDKESPNTFTNIDLKFCIRYRYENVEIWDNNSFKNYEVCLTHTPLIRHDKFSLNDSQEYEESPENHQSTGDDYFSYKRHDYGFMKPDASFQNYNQNYESNFSSPETPNLLKDCDTYKEPEDKISLDPILKDLNTFTGLNNPKSQQDRLSKVADGVNQLSLYDDSKEKSAQLLDFSTNTDKPLVFGSKSMDNGETSPHTIPQPSTFLFDSLRSKNNQSSSSYTTSKESTASKNGTQLPPMNSKSYQELIDAYCFFKDNDRSDSEDVVNSDNNPNATFVDTMFNTRSFINDENRSDGASSNNSGTNQNKGQTKTETSCLDEMEGQSL